MTSPVIATADVDGKAMSRIAMSFDGWYGILSTVLGLPPSASYLELQDGAVQAQMGWAFRSSFPRSTVESVAAFDMRPLSRGVHGFGGSWLVNGSGHGIVRIRLNPPQRAHVLGFPVRLQELLVSVADPEALRVALRHPETRPRSS